MGVAEKWRSGAASDRGLVRVENQDRSYVDDERGIFLVVDGLGGHAAGDRAAETAVEVIRHELASRNGDARRRVCDAITSANNRICELADEDESLRGMACVLTLAVLDGDRAVVGHVGDSRLYLIWNGAMRKLTSDHSPVGEREDRGELSEQEAMLHPRRHEVFSQRRLAAAGGRGGRIRRAARVCVQAGRGAVAVQRRSERPGDVGPDDRGDRALCGRRGPGGRGVGRGSQPRGRQG